MGTNQQPSDAAVAEYLRGYKGQLLPSPVFYAIAETMALPYIELLIYHPDTKRSEILLTRREEDDPYFPGLWHVPGTLLRAADLGKPGDNFGLAIERILNEELGGLTIGPTTLAGLYFHGVTRGVGLSIIHTTRAQGTPAVGQFFPVSHLPEDIIPEQAVFIRKTTIDLHRRR